MRRNRQIEREKRLLASIREHNDVYAVSKLMDESNLADLAKNHPNWYVRREALRNCNLRDQNVIGDVSFDESYMVRREAVMHLENQNLLVYISRNDPDAIVRINCIKKIRNRDIIVYAARHDPHWRVRRAAIEDISDAEVLKNLLKYEKNASVQDMIRAKMDSLM